jgi:AraC-like DNA-binding protein
LLEHAVAALLRPAAPSVEALARRIGWTRQHLARRFRAGVGLGPKALARIARMQRAVTRLQARREPVSATAAALAFADEAHLDREFRALVGASPAATRAARGSIRPIPSLFAGLEDPS